MTSTEKGWSVRFARSSGLILALALSAASLILGQETTGSVRGAVTDQTGGVVASARVELSGANLRPMVTVTSASGTFQFQQIPLGPGYSLAVTAPGFRTSKASGLNVELGAATTVEIKLEVGQLSDSVVVVDAAIVVDTQSSSSSVTVDRSFFDTLPKGRSFDGLINLAPGARAEGKSGGYQVDGSSGSENVFFLDGMEVTNIQNGTLSGFNRIPVEAIEQVQIKNGVMDAQYGGAMGGVVSGVIRSGANQFHGMAGFYFNNSAMQARDRQQLRLNPTNDALADYFITAHPDSFSTWNPIFAVGGHIVKDKLFFFSAYMPTETSTTRDVDFTTGDKATFSKQFVQRYMAHKVDYAPFSKMRISTSWIWSPQYNRGVLPSAGGTDAISAPWAGEGDYTSNNTISGQIDYTLGARTVASFRGGYNYNTIQTCIRSRSRQQFTTATPT